MTAVAEPPRVWVPLKVLARESKSIVAYYARIRGAYHLALALAGPPAARRWEIHVVVDRAGLLGEAGVAFIAGPKVLLRYQRLEEAARRLSRLARTPVYLPRWGVPAILAIDSRPPDPGELEELRRHASPELPGALERLAREVEIIEA